MAPYAVNRQVLLSSNYPPKVNKLRSIGIELIHSVQKFSNSSHDYAIGIGQSFLALFAIVEEPPEMECRVKRTDDAKEFNILVEMNSSSCVANGEW